MTTKTQLRAGEMAVPEGSRLLILDFYDGMTEGIIELGSSGPVLFLKMTGNELCGEVFRTFHVQELPEDSFEECVRILAEAQAPKWPVWYPIWEFNDEETQHAVEAVFDKVLSQGRRTEWELTSEDIINMENIRLDKIKVPQGLSRTA
jgi:hypothetical protein